MRRFIITTVITVAAISQPIVSAAADGPRAVAPPPDRRSLADGVATAWKVAGSKLPHADFIEQGGRRAGQQVNYAVAADGSLKLSRTLVWPSLRTAPKGGGNGTFCTLKTRDDDEAEPKIAVNGIPLGPVKVAEVRLDGTLTFLGTASSLSVKRVTFPSVDQYAALDRWTLTNPGTQQAVTVTVAQLLLSAERKSLYGMNRSEVSCDAPASTKLAPGASLSFAVRFAARQTDMPPVFLDAAKEEAARRGYIAGLSQALQLESPDPVLNRAFTFAKWRVAEAINDTRGGLMLAPGGLRYYAATWCNDNVEYAGPFFPFLGDQGGNQGSLNTYRQYIRYMKPSYERIPWSIVNEGNDSFGAFDRGDAAMYAYGASR